MADETLVVHPRWRGWAADNLVRGATAADVIAALVEEGVDEARARALVEEICHETTAGLAQRWHRRAQALEVLLRLRRAHRGPVADPIARTQLPTVDEFLARYWRPGVPVVITDLVSRWPAHGRWSPDDFAARFGDVVLEASLGRDQLARPDADWTELRRRPTMRQFVARITSTPGNDAYVIAKNDALRNPQLRPLLDEIALPADFFGPTLVPERMALWLGGAGTHTPLHHDTDNSMFCQVFGRKRFRLAPPESIGLLERSDGLYCRWDPTTASDLAGDPPEHLTELTLDAGEALFIPAGWWHQVDALDVSISVSNLHWAWPNDFAWYKPGTVYAGRAPG
jgi:hypothetical protein